MILKPMLLSQYQAELLMLKDCIQLCPDHVWTEGEHPRAYWRIVYHSLFYTHLYLAQIDDDFEPWAKHVDHGPILWLDDESGIPPKEATMTQADLMEYLEHITTNLPLWIETMDLESESTGFSWYPNMTKCEHQLLNLRHLGVHIGQLQERLYALGLDPSWKGRG